ncbi:hypothetical protein MHBO_002481 [Bonamia ostreae]|uniref:Uncharacterized protein n=1 Tax=Bonamia ostreae TaxID=126728 RepID=A0ABV2AMW9_9EUKA
MEEAKDALLVSLSAFEKDILFKNNDSPTNRILANYKILGQDGEEKPFMIRYSSLLKQYNRLKKKSENDTSEEEHAEKLNAKQSKIRKLQNSILKIDSKQQNYEEQLGDSTNRKPFENLENTKISEYKTMKTELEKLKWENRRSKKLEESLNSLIVKKNELSFDDQKSRERIAILKEKTSELKKREIEHLDEIERQERVLEAINESLEKDRFFIEGKKISLNESVSAEEAKFNHLIKSFHILRSKIKQLRNEISQAVSRKDHFAVFAEKVETEEKRRKKPEHLGKISQVKHRQFQASEHSKNLLSTVLKIAKFAQAKSDSLKDINSYNAFLKEAKIGRKKYKTQIASAKQDVAVVLAERLRVKAENEKRQSEILSSRNTTNRKIGEAVAELRAKSAEVAKRIYIFEKIATSPAKTLARDCAECGKENVFRIDFEERTTRFLCSNCQTNLAEIEFSENLRFSNKKRKVGKSDRKSKMATNKVKMGKCSVIKNEKLRCF